MKQEVLDFVSAVYGDDEDAFEWLQPIQDEMYIWSDEDEEYPTTFRIETVNELFDDRYDSIAYAIVCAMIDAGFVESEPEGLDWEDRIKEIIKEKMGL